MKVYEYVVLERDKYLVRRIDNKAKNEYKEYLVDLSNGDMLCDCKGFYFTKKACRHIKFILEQLAEGGGILNFDDNNLKNLTKRAK